MSPTDPASAPGFPPELRPALRRREPVALAALFEACFDGVYAYLRRLVGEPHGAEDLTQEVFVRVFESLDTYDPGRDPRPWILAIASAQARQYWRRRGGRGTQPDSEMDWEGIDVELPATQAGPVTELTREEARARLEQAVQELPPGLRAAVLLRAWEGLSFESIGAALELSEPAARKRYSRALAHLRGVLGGRPDEVGEVRP